MTSTKSIRLGDYLFLDYLSKFREVHFDNVNSLKTKWIRNSIFCLSLLSNMDACARAKGLKVERETDRRWWQQLIGLNYIRHSEWWRRQRYTWLSDVVLGMYLLFNCHLLLNLYYQYSLDFDKLRLMRLQAIVKQGLIRGEEYNRLAVVLLDRMADTSLRLLAIGAPHRHMSIVIECLQLYILLFVFIMYYCSCIFYRIFTAFDFHFVRHLLDPSEEQHHSEALIEGEVVRFVESSKMFTKLYQSCLHCGSSNRVGLAQHTTTRARLKLARPNDLEAKPEWPIFVGRRDEASSSSIMLQAPEQREIYDTLERMKRCGALRPYNKSLDSFERRNNHLSIGFAFLITFYILFFSTIFRSSLARRETSVPLSWSDLSIVGTLFGLIFIIGCSGTLMTPLFFASSLDQTIMVEKMRDLILHCIASNRYEFQQLNGTKEFCLQLEIDRRHRNESSRAEEAKIHRNIETLLRLNVHKMNANILFIFLQYKIFLAQYQPARRAFRAAVGFIVSLIMLIPIIIKLHMPYLSMFNLGNVKWFAVAFSPAILLPANFVLVPICRLDARFTNLYRVLSSLIAHITEIESHPNGHGIHNEHAVSLLLKEMRHTYHFKERSENSKALMTATYTTLVKAHFWLGLITLSILVDNQEYKDLSQLSSSFFSDPFSVFSRSNLLAME